MFGWRDSHSLVKVLRSNGLVAQSFQLVSGRHFGDFALIETVRGKGPNSVVCSTCKKQELFLQV